MKFSCTQENFISNLQIVSHIAGKGGTLPILSNILLKTSKVGLELTATNLEVAIITTVRGKVEGEGLVAVNARLLLESVNLFPKEVVSLELKETNIILKCGKQQTTIRGVVADDFPVIPSINQGNKLILLKDGLEKALNQVVFTINPEEGRPEIGGVYFKKINLFP